MPPEQKKPSALLNAIRSGKVIDNDEIEKLKQFRNTSELVKQSKQEALSYQKEYDKQQGAMGFLRNLPSGLYNTVRHPIQSGARVIKSIPNQTLGALNTIPYYNPEKKSLRWGDLGSELEKAAFINGLGTNGMSNESAESLWQNYVESQPERGGEQALGQFFGSFIPGAAAQKALMGGFKYAAPKFVANHSLATKVMTWGFGNMAQGQALADADATSGERLGQGAFDFAVGAAIPFFGPAWRAGKSAIFRSSNKTRLAGGDIVPASPPDGGMPPGAAAADMPIATVLSKEGDLAVATNNIEAVQNYIKGSGKTNIVLETKAPGALGTTKEGIPVTARHKFDPKTGTHTMYVSSTADAQTIAHEWGHYVDDAVAREVRGLSRYLFGDATTVKNANSIEDTVRSMAVRDLAESGQTTITPAQIDSKIGEILTAIRSEARSLAKQRPDPRNLSGEKKFGEQLSDAISVALTGPSAMRQGMFFRFLQEAKVVDSDLVKALRAAGRAEKTVTEAGEKTGLQSAVERQNEATAEKLGMGDKAPERAQRPPNRKYEQSRSEKEEVAFRDLPQRVVARSESQIQQALLKAKIPGKNTTQISVAGKKPVTMVVYGVDNIIMRAIQSGADSKYMKYAVREVMREFGMSRKGAEAYIANRFKELKTYAQNQADEGSYVLVKTVRGGAKEGVGVEKARLPEVKPKTDAEIKVEQTAQEDAMAFEEAKGTTLLEMELAEAGSRLFAPDGTVSGIASTFPKWVPEELRSKDLFEKVMEHINNGTKPAKNATRQQELYDIVNKTIDERAPQMKEGKFAEAEDIRMREEAAFERERIAAEEEYASEFMKTPDTAPGGPKRLTDAEAQPLKLDLDRMDTGKKPDTEAFRAEKMTDDADEEVFLNTKVLPEITGKYRISRSDQDIITQAEISKMDEGGFLEMLQTRVGALTPDVRAGFNIAMRKAEELRTMLGNRTAADLSPAELAQFKEKVAQTVQLFEVYSGIRTEASNLLRSFRIAVDKGEDDVLRSIFEDLQKAGVASEKDVWRAMAKTHERLTTNTKFDKYMKGLYAAWLSGPATTLRNIFGSLGNIASELASKGANPKTMKEFPAAVSNLFRDFVDKGLPDAAKVLKGQEFADNKFATFDPSFPLPENTFSKSNRTIYDRVTESVGRWLNAQDIALARTVQEMEQRSLRVYKPDISDAVAKAISDQYGLASVYRGMPKGRAVRGLVMGAETLTREFPQAKLFIPFIRTIGNVLDRQFDYMPIFSMMRSREKVLLEQARVIAKKYGISEEADIKTIMGRLKDQQMGRMYVGLAVTTAAVIAARSGRISGNGPSNYNERLMLERTGWRRNSVKIGNVWVPYTYIGPLAGILSLAGNMNDAIEYENASDKNVAEMVMNGMVGWMNTQLNSSFLKGTADLLDVLMGGKNAYDYFNDLGASLVPIPAAYSQTLNMAKNAYSHLVDDPSLRQQYETRNIVDSLRVKLGLTGDIGVLPALNPRSDMFGEPMTLDFIYGLTPTADKRQHMPVDNLLIKNGIIVTIPSKKQKYTIRNKEVEMTPDQYQRYIEVSGKEIYEKLTRSYSSLQKMKPEQLQDRVETITRLARQRARNDILR